MAHLVPRLDQRTEDSTLSCMDLSQFILMDHTGNIATVTVVFQYTHSCQETQYCTDRHLGGFFIDIVGIIGVDGKSICPIVLPVVIQGCCVVRSRLSEHYIGQAKEICQTCTGMFRLHHLHMRDKLPRHIKAGKLDPIAVALDTLKDTGSDTLRCAAVCNTRKFPVDICIIHGPEPLADVHGIMVDTGDDQDLIILCDMSVCFQIF